MNIGEFLNECSFARSTKKMKNFEYYSAGFIDKNDISIDFKNAIWINYVLVVVINGEGEYIDEENNKRYKLKSGMFFQRFPNHRHSNIINPNSDWKECFIEIPPTAYELLKQLNCCNKNNPVGIVNINKALLERFESITHALSNVTDAQIYSLFPNIFSLITDCLMQNKFLNDKDEEYSNQIIEKGCLFLGSSLDKKISIDDFCRRNGYSYEHFRKKFKNYLGISPHQYRIKRKMEAACSMLKNSNSPIYVIAEQLGYSSQYEFSSQFKKHYKTPPLKYRKQSS
ncbi:AraC family transcriptional regulator [Lentisphaerota bacterium WC36G]|nr:AraC family transcriptional regulator [Lentisphaerae bacterium WC36]